MTADRVEFDVRGMPVSQGSVRAFVAGNRAIVASVTAPLAAWRNAIATEAREATEGRAPMSGPLSVMLAFRFPRPRSHFLPANRSRPVPVLRLDAPRHLSGKPDADKVARAGLDALTGVAYIDDAQVSVLTVVKRYCADGEAPGVRVTVSTLPITE